MNITIILFIVLGAVTTGAVVEGVMLKKAYERSAVLEASNKALQNKLTEINNVLKRVDEIHQTNNALPDDELFKCLLPDATCDKR